MYALQADTGEIQWQFETEDWATTDPVLAEGILYFGVGAHANLVESTTDRLFYALEAATGEPAWTFRGSGPVYSAAALGNGAIYFKTLDNVLYALH
jgi:outer membrane protein assembly factor BamB